jgi:hypothetical protein
VPCALAAGEALEIGARPFGIERGLATQLRCGAAELFYVEFDQAEAVARDGDRRGEQFRQLLAAVSAHHLAPAGEIAGRADGDRAAQDLLAALQTVERELARDAAHEVERAHAFLAGDVAGCHALTREARHVGLDDVQGSRCRRRGIESVAAVAQDAGAGRRGQRMGGGHHAVPRCDCRTLAVLQHVLSPN